MNVQQQHGNWHGHYSIVVSFLILLYLLAAVGAGAYYMKTRCPYASLSACQAAIKDKCGSDILSSPEDCKRFTYEAEPCFCSECRFCLGPEQAAHCAKSNEERLKMCLAFSGAK